MSENKSEYHFPRKSFVSTQDGTARWETSLTGGLYEFIFGKEDEVKKLEYLDKTGPCSLKGLENVLDIEEEAIREILGERVRNFKEDILKKAKTLPTDSSSHLSEFN